MAVRRERAQGDGKIGEVGEWGDNENCIHGNTFQFPRTILNNIATTVSDSLAVWPEYTAVTCRIRKAKKAHLRQVGEVTVKA